MSHTKESHWVEEILTWHSLKWHELVGIMVISKRDNTTNLVSLSNFCREISRTHTQSFLLLPMLILITVQTLDLGPLFSFSRR